jgi:peptide/nickel transport system ATP-binding protein
VLAGIHLDVAAGETVALVGRSGAGKSTLARCLAGLERVDGGRIEVDGLPYRASHRRSRRLVQLVWQDPVASLSPFRTVAQSLAEPLDAFGIGEARHRTHAVRELLRDVDLGLDHLGRRPHEMSGGECQRVALARALACRPRVLVLDEPFASLDPPRQLQISDLVARLATRDARAVILISHDLTAVRRLSSRVALLHQGTIAVDLATAAFFSDGAPDLAEEFRRAWPPLPFDAPLRGA